MFNRDAIYTIHRNDWKNDPADRVMLVREGFAFWAFVLGPVWLLLYRLWLPALAYIALGAVINELGARVGWVLPSMVFVGLGVQCWLGCNANDLRRWGLARRGYTMRGVVVAESALMAQRRVLEQA